MDKRLHRLPSLFDPIEEVAPRLVELFVVVLAEEARETQQSDERRAQIVGQRVDAMFELFVGADEFRLVAHSFTDVAQVEQRVGLSVEVASHGAGGCGDVAMAAARTPKQEVAIAQRLVPLKAAEHAFEIFRIGNQRCDRHTDDPFGRPTEDFLRRGVGETDPSA